MAFTERPDLFAGDRCGSIGQHDAVEFSRMARRTFRSSAPSPQQGFTNLYAMDSYQHVKDGATYPAVLVTTEPRPRVIVDLAKFAARLRASGADPVLLRIENDGGHGVGAPRHKRTTRRRHFGFIFWRGRAGLAARRQALKRTGADFGPPIIW